MTKRKFRKIEKKKTQKKRKEIKLNEREEKKSLRESRRIKICFLVCR